MSLQQKLIRRPQHGVPPYYTTNRSYQFPFKLHEMLAAVALQGNDATVSWQPHGRAFRVHDKAIFAASIMLEFFKQTHFKSFQRQLHLWGFKRINHGLDEGAYYHLHFVSGQTDRCKAMLRQKIKGPLPFPYTQSPDPDFYHQYHHQQQQQHETPSEPLVHTSQQYLPLLKNVIKPQPLILDSIVGPINRDLRIQDQADARSTIQQAFLRGKLPSAPITSSPPPLTLARFSLESSSVIDTYSKPRENAQSVPFPFKLHDVLGDAEKDTNTHIVSWLPHGRGFKVNNIDVFVESIMPLYFRQTQYKSFQRQLNLWGFKRISKGNEKGSYCHPYFVRWDKDQCLQITHTSIKGTVMRRFAPLSSRWPYNNTSPGDYIASIKDSAIRKGVQELHNLIRKVAPGLEPETKYEGTLGYGTYHFKYKRGRLGEWCKIGISHGKEITLHCCGMVDGKNVLEGFAGRMKKATTGMASLRFQKLEDLDPQVLEELIIATAGAEDLHEK